MVPACSKRMDLHVLLYLLVLFYFFFFPLVPEDSSIRMLMYIYNVIVSFIDVRTFARADAYIIYIYIGCSNIRETLSEHFRRGQRTKLKRES